ncbi:MAG TPA: HdeA/HdeB family chaperone, partial [Stellaceae bacterium]|nr:HdeA/HdeB family chaperone [Stellaceae bacterium]
GRDAMISKLALVALPVTLLVACTPAPAPAPAPPPPPPAAAPPPAPAAEPASTAPIPIRTLSCAEILGASDDDRAAAAMFFIGYQASRAQVRNLSISQIQAIEETALAACSANQSMPAVRAFAQAVRENRK